MKVSADCADTCGREWTGRENTNSGGIGVKLVELDNINSDVNKLRKCWVSPGKMCGKSFLFT